MTTMTRRTALAALGAGGVLLGAGYLLGRATNPPTTPPAPEGMSGMMGGGMMGAATQTDMARYMQMFQRHQEISRTVQAIPGGVRTTTESTAPELVTQLQAHVTSMYAYLDQNTEVNCMSPTLPTLFRHAPDYHRQLTLTPTGVIAEETARDPNLIHAIRAHADEVSDFVRDGMPAMMSTMMRPGR